MKIALGQINVKQGKPTENLAAMREMIAQAKACCLLYTSRCV